MPKGEQREGQELGAFFGADLDGLYRQHEAMWTVYIDSLKILVTITGLPLLGAAVLIREGKDLPTLPQMISALWAILLLAGIIDVFMLAVVINHRLTILLYARAINGYRGLFLDKYPEQRASFETYVHLPIRSNKPDLYEPLGPLGVVVHAIGLVGGAYVALGAYKMGSLGFSVVAVAVYLAAIEYLYYANCHKYPRVAEVRPQAHP